MSRLVRTIGFLALLASSGCFESEVQLGIADKSRSFAGGRASPTPSPKPSATPVTSSSRTGLSSAETNGESSAFQFDGTPSVDALSSNPNSVASSGSSPLATPYQCAELATTVPRGISCIHCMHERAQKQSDVLVRLLQQSCLKNVALDYLVDNSFGFSAETALRHIDALTADGRKLFLHIYLLNGPSQRRFQSTTVSGAFTKMSPEAFRTRIFEDAAIQNKVRALVKRVLPVLRYAAEHDAVISLVPMLEDNLDQSSFEKLAEIVASEIPATIPFSLGRNPCPSCYKGNDSFIPPGVFTERHLVGRARYRDGVVSNDGVDFSLTAKKKASNIVPLTQLKIAREDSTQKNNIFILWSAKHQGLKAKNGSVTGTSTSPAKRDYGVPTASERRAILAFLKGE